MKDRMACRLPLEGRDWQPICWHCGALASNEPAYRCEACGGSLDIAYNYDSLLAKTSFDRMEEQARGEAIWGYRRLLPVLEGVEAVSLGEGNTPLIKIRNIQNNMEINPGLGGVHNFPASLEIYLKMESHNPTLAFKDRPLAVALTVARQFGMKRVVCASTGNTGVAASAYAARAGIHCTVYVPADTPPEKLEAMLQYGAQLEPVQGSFSDAYARAGEVAEADNLFNLTSTYLNPYAAEGDKTVAYELFRQLGGRVPDWIVVPIGAGPLLSGIYKGFGELRLAGLVDRLPRMVGVQAEGCAPIAEAFREGREAVEPWLKPVQSAASGIADPLAVYPEDGTRTLSVIRQSGGMALAVPEQELLEWRRLLASREGILAELSSVTATAAISQLVACGAARGNDMIVAIVTGHGLKDMSVAINKK